MAHSDDELILLAEDPKPDALDEAPPWRILVADDDSEVHEATRLTLSRTRILGRRLELLHAYSAAEARAILERESGIAVLLLDVVMEREDAGLTLVSEIREELGMRELRIVLRTGQPGRVPELETVARYDVNDYRTKTELSYERLITTLTSALRSFTHLERLRASEAGLRQIIAASHAILAAPGLRGFAEGVIVQIAAMLGTEAENILIGGCETHTEAALTVADYRILAAAGRRRKDLGQPIESIREATIRDLMCQALEERSSQFAANGRRAAFYMAASGTRPYLAYVETTHPLNADERDLLDQFCKSMAHYARSIERVSGLSRVAYADPLVALPNANGLRREISRRLRGDGASEGLLSLIQLRDFEDCHALLGIDYADDYLRAVSERLRRALPAEAMLARVGRDVFAVYGEVRELGPELIALCFEEPLLVHEVERVAAIGLSWVRVAQSTRGADSYLGEAWAALHASAQVHAPQACTLDSEALKHFMAGSDFLAELRHALQRGNWLREWEDICACSDGRLLGRRLQLSWPPSLAGAALRTAILQCSGLIAQLLPKLLQSLLNEPPPAGLRVCLPTSVQALAPPLAQHKLLRILAEAGLAPTQLELELTDEAQVPPAALRQLAALGAAGVMLSLRAPLRAPCEPGLPGITTLHLEAASADSAERAALAQHAAQGRTKVQQLRLGGVSSAAQLAQARKLGCSEISGPALAALFARFDSSAL